MIRGRRPNLEAARAARTAVELPRLEGLLADSLRLLGLAAVAGLERHVPPDFVCEMHRLRSRPRVEGSPERAALDQALDVVLAAVAKAQGLTLPRRAPAPVAMPRDLFAEGQAGTGVVA